MLIFQRLMYGPPLSALLLGLVSGLALGLGKLPGIMDSSGFPAFIFFTGMLTPLVWLLILHLQALPTLLTWPLIRRWWAEPFPPESFDAMLPATALSLTLTALPIITLSALLSLPVPEAYTVQLWATFGLVGLPLLAVMLYVASGLWGNLLAALDAARRPKPLLLPYYPDMPIC